MYNSWNFFEVGLKSINLKMHKVMTEIHDHLKTPDLYRHDQVPISMTPENAKYR
jgi:hypothetical protein